MESFNLNESIVLQTLEPPMTVLNAVKDHADALRAFISWNRVGVLIDEGPQAMVTVLLKGDRVVGTSRFCLSAAQSVDAIKAYNHDIVNMMELRCWEGCTISIEQVRSLSELTAIWRQSIGQRKVQTYNDWRKFYDDVKQTSFKKGRGTNVRTATRNQVLLDAHGRCMFEGCGVDLTLDSVTGKRGNFATLAHNVASSESGPRGVLYLSHALADDPDNILLLCETHHRLVDKVAKADYPAATLSEMRSRFCDVATELLDTLSLVPMPVYSIAWPVHRQKIAPPSIQQIAQMLKLIDARPDGTIRHVSYNESLLCSLTGVKLWTAIQVAVDQAAANILQQAHGEEYRAALFAMGLMPALIALGAKLGNKCEIMPMLRYRDNGRWYWPVREPRGEFFKIDGLDKLSNSEGEVCLLLALTAKPESMLSTAASLGIKMVSVVARAEYLGNGALGHPDDGTAFRQRMQELLHQLRDTYGVRTVHVLSCASNAVCVFFGQGFDSYHPNLVLYDFHSDGTVMVPRLLIKNVNNECTVETVEVMS